jgi:predicted phage terminase large subunit-like protein
MFDPADIDLKSLDGLSPDALIEALGGEEGARELLNYGRFMHVMPVEARGDILKLAQYCMRDPEAYYDPDRSRYQVNVHHRLIADAFTEVLEGRNLRLILSIPPQFGKSTIAKHFMAAHIGRYPWKHLLMGTYNATFAAEYGDDVRAIILSSEFKRVYDVQLRMGSKAKDHFVTSHNGKNSFLGREGSGSGRPADGFLIDDPIKDAKEAGSKTNRDDVWEWFNRVANARCHVMTWQIIIAKQWTVINVPAEIDQAEMAAALGKNVGDALWPERFPLQLLHTAKAMDPTGYSALYMGRPTPPEGAFFKGYMLHTYGSAAQFPKRARMYLTGDLALSPDRYADKSCVGIWGVDENDDLWLHPELYWDRKASDESVNTIIDYGCRHQIMDAWFEKGQLDKAIGPFLEKRMQEELAAGKKAYFPITRLPVSGNKGMRALAIRGRMAQGRVHFPEFAPWWPAAKEQLLKFSGTGNDKEDDFADMISLIGQALEGQIKAATEATNVVNFPKVGTLAWTKWAHNQQKAREKRLLALGGM